MSSSTRSSVEDVPEIETILVPVWEARNNTHSVWIASPRPCHRRQRSPMPSRTRGSAHSQAPDTPEVVLAAVDEAARAKGGCRVKSFVLCPHAPSKRPPAETGRPRDRSEGWAAWTPSTDEGRTRQPGPRRLDRGGPRSRQDRDGPSRAPRRLVALEDGRERRPAPRLSRLGRRRGGRGDAADPQHGNNPGNICQRRVAGTTAFRHSTDGRREARTVRDGGREPPPRPFSTPKCAAASTPRRRRPLC